MMASCKAVVFLPLAVLLTLGIPATAVAQNAQNAKLRPADTICANGQVYTEKATPSWAQAVAVRGEKIIAVGDDADILKLRGPATKVIDAGGKLVLPGFVDCRIHSWKAPSASVKRISKAPKTPLKSSTSCASTRTNIQAMAGSWAAVGTTPCSVKKIFPTKNISTSCSQIGRVVYEADAK